MTFEEARKQVVSAIHSATGALNEKHVWNKLAQDDVDFSDVELDSLAAMEVCVELEEKTGVEIDLGHLAQHPSVNALARFIVVKARTNHR
jgi:acyl carrier protein